MAQALTRRAVSFVLVLLALTFAVFVIQSTLPDDPVAAQLGAGASKERIEQKRMELGFDKPIHVQYGRYLDRVVQGDLGVSLHTRRSVADDLGRFVPATAELALAAFAWTAVLSAVLGLWSASRARGSEVIRMLMVGLASAPTFFVAIILILVCYSWLGWLPAAGRTSTGNGTGFIVAEAVLAGDLGGVAEALRHLVLPSFVLALAPAVAIGRVLRGALLDAARQDYIRTARAKGLSRRRVLVAHGVRNALTPTLTMAGLQVGLMLTGIVVVESIFAWPGLGSYTATALANSDFPAVTGITLVLGAVYVSVNAAVDMLQVVADPRLRTT